MVKQNEKTFLEAINYETVLLAGHFSDSKAGKLFRRLRTWCNSSAPIAENLDAYTFITGLSKEELHAAEDVVVKAFENLSPDTLIITNSDSAWPEGVKNPLFLYLKGDEGLLKRKSISIVGTRAPSEEGVRKARESVDLLGSEYVITSGLARGIDGVAHIEALSKGFKTIAVLGNPLSGCYPPEHKGLQEYIALNGLLVSEYGPARTVQQYYFIQRNSLMSEISSASLVVESEDGGGGVRQAKYAEKQGKDVILFEDAYKNSALKWPREFEKPVVSPGAEYVLDCVHNPEKYRVQNVMEL